MYAVEVKKKAQKEIQSLPKKDQQRIIATFDILRTSPFAGKKLEGKYDGAYSLRVWPYRIIYTIHKEIVTVIILRVRHRQGAYKS